VESVVKGRGSAAVIATLVKPMATPAPAASAPTNLPATPPPPRTPATAKTYAQLAASEETRTDGIETHSDDDNDDDDDDDDDEDDALVDVCCDV
jgi:hypothetical protein